VEIDVLPDLLAQNDLGEGLLRMLSLRDPNTRVVVAGVTLLGVAAGIIGTFLLLRRRALVSDALAHATLPGIALAFIAMVILGGTGKFLPGLLLGATVMCLVGALAILLIRSSSRLKEDAALGIVLSVFFGLGVALLGMVQRMSGGNAAGLESFIYGKPASILFRDAVLIAATAGVMALAAVLLFKEFTLLCFDQAFARAQGYRTVLLDLLLMALVVLVTVVGLQAVGLILVVALLIIPPAAARFWTDKLMWMVVGAAAIGGWGGLTGALASGVAPKMPAGAMIVLSCALVFIISLIFGRKRGLLPRAWEQRKLGRKIRRQNLLRALYESVEKRTAEAATDPADVSVPVETVQRSRSWSPREFRRALGETRRQGLVRRDDSELGFTPHGIEEASRIVRNHRLWELYLITHADIAPSHVDRDADAVEHVLGDELMDELRELLAERYPRSLASPH
jgi:manganese/zinc/iron transport system permease protein